MSLIVIVALVGVIIALQDDDDADQLTAWAVVRSRELHDFFQVCRSDGGSIDVRTSNSPQIVFVCEYLDRMVEYTLDPGK